jgi:hypothetical protein
MVTIVLLNVAWTCATPFTPVRFSRFFFVFGFGFATLQLPL